MNTAKASKLNTRPGTRMQREAYKLKLGKIFCKEFRMLEV
jgi:hypothetical protein